MTVHFDDPGVFVLFVVGIGIMFLLFGMLLQAKIQTDHLIMDSDHGWTKIRGVRYRLEKIEDLGQ